jgi:hypothetical protein
MIATLPLVNRDYIAQTGVIPEGFQFIQDSRPLQVIDMKKVLAESASGSKVPVMRCTGVFQRADERNANGRVYPHDILKEAVGKLQPIIKERRVMGEFDHPPDAKIHLDRVSHLITKLWMEGKTVMGEIEVLNDTRMPYGSQLACLLERKVQIGISSRGVGDMEIVMHEGEDSYQVQPGYEFVTFDSVAEPSVSGTQLNQLRESRERRMNPKQLKEAREKILAREIGNFLLIG